MYFLSKYGLDYTGLGGNGNQFLTGGLEYCDRPSVKGKVQVSHFRHGEHHGPPGLGNEDVTVRLFHGVHYTGSGRFGNHYPTNPVNYAPTDGYGSTI